MLVSLSIKNQEGKTIMQYVTDSKVQLSLNLDDENGICAHRKKDNYKRLCNGKVVCLMHSSVNL